MGPFINPWRRAVSLLDCNLRLEPARCLVAKEIFFCWQILAGNFHFPSFFLKASTLPSLPTASSQAHPVAQWRKFLKTLDISCWCFSRAGQGGTLRRT